MWGESSLASASTGTSRAERNLNQRRVQPGLAGLKRSAATSSRDGDSALPCIFWSLQPNDPVTNICQAADKQLFTLVEWAKRIPHFSSLPLDDQVILLRAGQ